MLTFLFTTLASLLAGILGPKTMIAVRLGACALIWWCMWGIACKHHLWAAAPGALAVLVWMILEHAYEQVLRLQIAMSIVSPAPAPVPGPVKPPPAPPAAPPTSPPKA